MGIVVVGVVFKKKSISNVFFQPHIFWFYDTDVRIVIVGE